MSDKNTEIKLKPETEQFAETLAKSIKVGSDGVATIDETAYESTLPEGVTLKQVKDIQKHNSTFVAASALALSQPAFAAFKKHKTLDEVTLSIAVGEDRVEHCIERSKLVGAPGGEKTPRAGYLTTKYDVRGAGSNRGELKKVRAVIANNAIAAAIA